MGESLRAFGVPAFELELDLGNDGVWQLAFDQGSDVRESGTMPVGSTVKRASQSLVDGPDAEDITPVSGVRPQPWMSQMRDLYASGDVAAASQIAARIAGGFPAARPRSADSSDSHTAVFSPDAVLAKVSALRGVPRLAAANDVLCTLPLDARLGFIISLIDGRSSIADLCDLSAIHEDEMVALLGTLAAHHVIAFD
jgi:hypothetical protein